MKVFKSLDINNDGTLSREELVIGYSKIMPKEEAEIEIDKIMKNIDFNNNGDIEYSEFVMATLNKS